MNAMRIVFLVVLWCKQLSKISQNLSNIEIVTKTQIYKNTQYYNQKLWISAAMKVAISSLQWGFALEDMYFFYKNYILILAGILLKVI